MKKGFLLSLSLFMIITACNKDKLHSTPSLKFKSVNGTVIPPQGVLQVRLEFTDKEGDVNDTLYVKKIRINTLQTATIRDSFPLRVPDFPKTTQGEIQVNLDYNNYLVSAISPPLVNGKPIPDTLMIKFALKDKANHISDTVTIGPIVVIR